MRQAWFISLLVFAFACADAKKSESPVDAAVDMITPDASMSTRKAQAGEACQETADCASLPLFCVDGVCCKSLCDGACEQCDLGDAGECAAAPINTDPDNECGELECNGYFHGWSGDACHTRANVSAIEATCDGAGACQTAETLCSQPGDPGPAASACVAGCQTPDDPGTCTGTTPGTCSGPDDPQEPNNSCAEVVTLPILDGLSSVPPNQGDPPLPGQITPAGDVDVLEIIARENDAVCCDDSENETYVLQIFPSAPDGAGSGPIEFCTGLSCGAEKDCQTVNAGGGGFIRVQFPSLCSEQREHRVYLRVSRPDGGATCGQYELGYELLHSCP